MRYHANGIEKGPVRYGRLSFSIGVHAEAGSTTPIGHAEPWMWDPQRR